MEVSDYRWRLMIYISVTLYVIVSRTQYLWNVSIKPGVIAKFHYLVFCAKHLIKQLMRFIKN